MPLNPFTSHLNKQWHVMKVYFRNNIFRLLHMFTLFSTSLAVLSFSQFECISVNTNRYKSKPLLSCLKRQYVMLSFTRYPQSAANRTLSLHFFTNMRYALHETSNHSNFHIRLIPSFISHCINCKSCVAV